MQAVASRLASVSTRNHRVWDIGGRLGGLGFAEILA
jgi:hypothetical protein